MGQFLQLILDNLFKLWPVRIIDPNQQGVLFDRGRDVKLLKPGVHWFFPGVQHIEVFMVAYQGIDLGQQTIETRDGISVTFSANVSYTITDASKVAVEIYNFDSTLRNVARGLLAKLMNAHPHEEIHAKLPHIQRVMRRVLRKQFRNMGVRIEEVLLDEFVRARAIRHLGGLIAA
jgi:erythrocyte band 7 integral membrane protein